ncbi:MAG: hypothetical protein ACXVYB_00260 [Arthrobacter sp.]
MAKMRTYLYAATLKDERHEVFVTLESPAYRKDEEWLTGELQLWIDNDQELYDEFYGRHAGDEVTCAEHEDVAITEVVL